MSRHPTIAVRHPVFDRRRGFALPSAIFLLVILSLLGAFIVQISTKQQVGHAADVRGSHAAQAAQAGVEWGLWRLLRQDACDAPTSFNPGGGLSGFTVTVNCLPNGMATSNDEAGNAVIVRRIVATACSEPAAGACPNPAPGANYIERQFSTVAVQ
ncbi:MAG: agglutinin biogenesis protein MshP [Betaproteobacteria bacterium HGW-Betaproteobacteria-12]|nr:MAG: agglutinin biogenesis protein MshP [Betaproteobacteria bacterium HGW-Betaproteobacteria-12]